MTTAFSCAKRAADPKNEFAACRDHCGNDDTCLRELPPLTHCAASSGQSGCVAGCPQAADGEPAATGRSCPLPVKTATAAPAEDPEMAAFVADAREVERLSALYYELLFAVGEKHPGETRHQTALRYIQQAEAPQDNPAQQREVKR